MRSSLPGCVEDRGPVRPRQGRFGEPSSEYVAVRHSWATPIMASLVTSPASSSSESPSLPSGRMGKHEIADLGRRVPDPDLALFGNSAAHLLQEHPRLTDHPGSVRRTLVPVRWEPQRRATDSTSTRCIRRHCVRQRCSPQPPCGRPRDQRNPARQWRPCHRSRDVVGRRRRPRHARQPWHRSWGPPRARSARPRRRWRRVNDPFVDQQRLQCRDTVLDRRGGQRMVVVHHPWADTSLGSR